MQPRTANLIATALAWAVMATPPVAAVPDLLQYTAGQVPFGGNCLDVNSNTLRLTSYWCNGGPNQLFELVQDRYLHAMLRPNSCLEYGADNSVFLSPKCEAKFEQEWRVTPDGQIAAVGYDKFGKCLDGVGPSYNNVTLVDCDVTRAAQRFRSSNIVPTTGVPLQAGSSACIDWYGSKPDVYGHPCHGGGNQFWQYTYDDELRVLGNNCMDILDE